MRFYLPLFILLTTLSPKLNAATIDPTTYPWEFDATFQNAPVLEALNIDDSIMTIAQTRQLGGGNLELFGKIDVFDGTRSWGTAQIGGWRFSNDLVLLGMEWGSLDFQLIGVEQEPGLWIGGLRGLGSSDIVGSWKAMQTSVPEALLLMGSALVGLALLARPGKPRHRLPAC